MCKNGDVSVWWLFLFVLVMAAGSKARKAAMNFFESCFLSELPMEQNGTMRFVAMSPS